MPFSKGSFWTRDPICISYISCLGSLPLSSLSKRPSPPQFRCTSKRNSQILLTVTVWLWMFPVDSPQASQFLCQLCDSTMSACLLKRHFSNRFLHCINFTIHFLHQQQIFTHCKMLLCNFFFPPTSLSDFKFLQKDFLCLFVCCTIFLIQIRGAGH